MGLNGEGRPITLLEENTREALRDPVLGMIPKAQSIEKLVSGALSEMLLCERSIRVEKQEPQTGRKRPSGQSEKTVSRIREEFSEHSHKQTKPSD